jgi:hypothetical protein
MKTELRKVYKCEYCGKTMLSAGAMARHEKWCRKNPHNKHKCFALCKFLKRKIVVEDTDGEYGIYHSEFTCKCMDKNKKMYSYLLEKRLAYTFDKIPEGLTRMPLECNMYEEMSWDEQSGRFEVNNPQTE